MQTIDLPRFIGLKEMNFTCIVALYTFSYKNVVTVKHLLYVCIRRCSCVIDYYEKKLIFSQLQFLGIHMFWARPGVRTVLLAKPVQVK